MINEAINIYKKIFVGIFIVDVSVFHVELFRVGFVVVMVFKENFVYHFFLVEIEQDFKVGDYEVPVNLFLDFIVVCNFDFNLNNVNYKIRIMDEILLN